MSKCFRWDNKGHQFDEIAYKLKHKKKIYIYGAGAVAKDILNIIEGSREWIKWDVQFVDRDIKMQQNGYDGYTVISPDEFFEKGKVDYFVVVCAVGKGQEEILEGLENNNICKDDIYIYDYFMFTYLPIHFIYNHDIVFFATESLVPSTICNLNCRSCLNFNPYIRTPIVDEFTAVKQDIDIFFEKIDLVYRFQISGGETLLYKDLNKIIEYIGENYSEKIIRFEVVTNGTIKPSTDVCKLLSKYKVTVFLDDYRNSISNGDEKLKLVQKCFDEMNVKYINNYVEKWICMYPAKEPHAEMGESELQEYYTKCLSPFSTLRDKKISGCNYAHYAAKAGIENDYENESFDLTKVNYNNRKELIEFRLRYNEKGYAEFCRKCGGWSAINNYTEKAAIQVK